MGTIRDPNFWKRFSTAVHQDDALKEELAKRPNLSHSYVTTLTLQSSSGPYHHRTPSPPLTTPNSQTPIMSDPAPLPQSPAPTLSNPFPKFSQHPKPQSPMVLQPMTATRHQTSSASASASISASEPGCPQISHTRTHSSTQPISPRTPTTPNHPHDPDTPSRSTFPAKFTRHTNTSMMTLGLSGRPQSRFKFWTSVTADPSNRNSWLESQQRKQRQRTYMCWGFWGGLLMIAAGVVAAVLVLKSKRII